MTGAQQLHRTLFRITRAPHRYTRFRLPSERCVSVHAAQSKELVYEVQAVPITKEAFEPFGQYIEAIDDMKAFDTDDAQLNLANGTPRFYIMRLRRGPVSVQVTFETSRPAVHTDHPSQGSNAMPRQPHSKYMAVAKPGIEQVAPEDISAFKVPFGAFIKMHAGTWHAGPHFDELEHMDFYNLELADTNQVDHYNFHFDKEMGAAIKVIPC